jgi:hypothetical protein
MEMGFARSNVSEAVRVPRLVMPVEVNEENTEAVTMRCDSTPRGVRNSKAESDRHKDTGAAVGPLERAATLAAPEWNPEAPPRMVTLIEPVVGAFTRTRLLRLTIDMEMAALKVPSVRPPPKAKDEAMRTPMESTTAAGEPVVVCRCTPPPILARMDESATQSVAGATVPIT